MGLWDATITPSGTLWLSTQDKLTSYRIGRLPGGLTTLLGPAKIEGFGRRTGKIDWWVSQHGNGTGVTAVSDSTVVVVNVEHADASDDNPGTEQLPLKSISRAAELAMANNTKGTGTKVLIAPGIYRDAVELPNRGKEQTEAPMIFEATQKGGAVLTGSDVLTDWRRLHAQRAGGRPYFSIIESVPRLDWGVPL